MGPMSRPLKVNPDISWNQNLCSTRNKVRFKRLYLLGGVYSVRCLLLQVWEVREYLE